MSHWLHKSARNRLNLWFKLGLLSFAAHGVLLALLFFVYRGSIGDLAFTIRAAQINNSIDVIWVKTLSSRSVNAKGSSGAANKGIAKKSVARKSPVKSAPKTELKSEVAQKKKAAQKKEIKKKAEIKKSAKKIPEKNKTPEKKKVEEKKKEPEIKKIEPKNKIVEDQIQPIPQSTRDERLDKKSDQQKNIDANLTKPTEETNAPVDVEDQEFEFEISGSYRELEALKQFQELQQEISRCWRPPVGIGSEVSCQIKVSFDWNGKAQHIETVKPSGILMFDVSSRNAVHAMEAPKFVRGKTFTITFKP